MHLLSAYTNRVVSIYKYGSIVFANVNNLYKAFTKE